MSSYVWQESVELGVIVGVSVYLRTTGVRLCYVSCPNSHVVVLQVVSNSLGKKNKVVVETGEEEERGHPLIITENGTLYYTQYTCQSIMLIGFGRERHQTPTILCLDDYKLYCLQSDQLENEPFIVIRHNKNRKQKQQMFLSDDYIAFIFVQMYKMIYKR